MKPDYKNWMPKGMICGGFAVTLVIRKMDIACFATATEAIREIWRGCCWVNFCLNNEMLYVHH